MNETASATPVSTTRPKRTPNKPLEITLHDLWRRVLDRSDFGVDESFGELGGRPSQAARMLAETEVIIRRPVAEGAWRKQLTIRNLTKAICEEAEKDTRLVTCARPGEGRPFFFCHGDFSTRGFYALVMAERLGGSRPVHLLHPAFEPGGTASAEQMATPYVDEIERLQPTGPIDLGGYCNGGLVAWEIATQLAARGRELNRLILVDTSTLNARLPLRIISWLAADRRAELMPKLWISATHRHFGRLDRARDMLVVLAGKSPDAPPPGPSRIARVEVAALRCLASYRLPHAPCHVDVIVSEESAANIELQARPLRSLTRSLSRHVVPGEHQTCITTHVDALAEVLTPLLQAPPPRRKAVWRGRSSR